MRVTEARRRVAIEGVSPEIDCGRFPAKRTVGETFTVEADIFADGHDQLACYLRYRTVAQTEWTDLRMESLGNDRWRATFPVADLCDYRYTLRAWIDRFLTWREDLRKRVEAGQDVSADLRIGAEHVVKAARRAAGSPADAGKLKVFAGRINDGARGHLPAGVDAALDQDLLALMEAYPDQTGAVTYEKELAVAVDRERARFSSWYEVFPRSTSKRPGRAGTFRALEKRLPYVAKMGFDVLYLPPIHPIGRSFRKGKNNAPEGTPEEPGSPWAIGSEEGGHTAIDPSLGTFDDFDHLVAAAAARGLEVALDVAFQCSPDHPWVKEHPQWFRHRPDGTIQYAENPPKKYQDIYPLNFETEDWQGLWEGLRGVFLFWIERGIKLFRVDNPHTKSFAFWEWCIASLRADHPEIVLLSEAFTRPRIMYRLAKLGFNQSYTYFTWRTTKAELVEYLTELTTTEVAEYFRPNFWPNTPDILPFHLQGTPRAAFAARLILAATLSPNYGIYGPAFELMDHTPLGPGREEYLNSEKYEIREWDLDRPDSLAPVIARVNRIRREHPALQSMGNLWFHHIDNDMLLVFSKTAPDLADAILVVVNLDPTWTQSGWVDLSLPRLGLAPTELYQVQDLLTDARYVWQGAHNYVELDPAVLPAHVFRIRRRIPAGRTYPRFE